MDLFDLAIATKLSGGGGGGGSKSDETLAKLVDGSVVNAVIPSGATNVRLLCFRNCSNLEMVDLPETVKVMDSNVFYNCTSLKTIIVRATTPPSIIDNTFNTVPADCAIYVPSDAVDVYKATNWWKTRKEYIQPIP